MYLYLNLELFLNVLCPRPQLRTKYKFSIGLVIFYIKSLGDVFKV